MVKIETLSLLTTFGQLKMVRSGNKKMWAAMGRCPLRISKEKIQSLRSSKINDLQNRPKMFQLLVQFAIIKS